MQAPLADGTAGFRPGDGDTTIRYAKQVLRLLARRHQALTSEIEELTTQINHLCAQVNPALLVGAEAPVDHGV